jgi:phosphoribosylformimino-5-aminoimidazole carboxamide ribotide isomerase
MVIYPAIDLLDGRCVRLLQGDFDAKTEFSDDPVGVAQGFFGAGSPWLHMVDLSGAKAGKPVQTELMRKVAASTKAKIQSGGGVRDADAIETLLDLGVTRVIVGSKAVSEPATVTQWLRRFGSDRILLALDVRIEDGMPYAATHGWVTGSGKSLWAVMDAYAAFPPVHVMCTDIGRDGMMTGPNIWLYEVVRERYPDLQLQASGGVSCLEDLSALRRSGLVSGVIVGKALYAGKFTIQEALAC